MKQGKAHDIKSRGFKKPVIVIDVDDTLINSSEVVIDILNRNYDFTERIKKSPISKIYDNLSSWEYFSFFCKNDDILRNKIDKEVKEIFESEMFWNNVRLKKDIDLLFKKFGSKFKWIINSMGTKKNLEFKKDFLTKHLPDNIDYEIVLKHKNWGEKIEKEDLIGDVIIDDRIDVLLKNNSPIKILLTNFRKTDYNGGFGKDYYRSINEQIYRIDDINDLINVLEFYKEFEM